MRAWLIRRLQRYLYNRRMEQHARAAESIGATDLAETIRAAKEKETDGADTA